MKGNAREYREARAPFMQAGESRFESDRLAATSAGYILHWEREIERPR